MFSHIELDKSMSVLGEWRFKGLRVMVYGVLILIRKEGPVLM